MEGPAVVPSLRQDIETALIARIDSCLGRVQNPVGGYLCVVDTYNGEIDQTDGPDQFIKRIRGRFPSALIGPGGSVYENESSARTRFMETMTWELYVGSNHMRSKEHRHGSDNVSKADANADPGIYQIIQDIQQLISGSDLGISKCGYFEPRRSDVLLQEDKLTIWRLTYVVDVDAHVKPRDHGDEPLSSYEINGNIFDIDPADPPNPVVEADGSL